MACVHQPQQGSVAQLAHQGLLPQLQHLAPKYINGTAAMAMMESTRLMPVGVDRYAAFMPAVPSLVKQAVPNKGVRLIRVESM